MTKRKRPARCKVCGKEKTTPPKASHVTRLEYERDPYCSTACCRADHGIALTTGATSS